MNINQLLVLSFLIFLYTINKSNNLYENLENQNIGFLKATSKESPMKKKT